MDLQPLIPWWWLLGSVLCASLVSIWYYRRRGVLLALRLAAIAILAVMLANPVTPVVVPTMVRPTIALVVDASGSMATTDADHAASRFAAASAGMDALARRMPDATISRYGLRQSLLSSVPAAPEGDTDFAALTDFAQMTPPPQAVVLISDGADWQGSDPEDALSRAGVTLHTVGVGGHRMVENLVVRMSAGSPTVFRDQELPLQIMLSATPGLVGRMLPLTIEAVADDGSCEVVARQDVMLTDVQRVTIPVAVGTALGARLWRATLPVLPGEVRADDNVAFASTQVVYRSMHVQVIEGRPWWDTTCAVRAWRRDLQLEVATSYRLGGRDRQDGSACPRPITAAALAKLDVLVLGMECALSPSEVQAIQSWVQGGGGLMLLGAVAVDPGLSILDPLERQTQRIQVPVAALMPRDGAPLHGDAAGTIITMQAHLRPQAQLIVGTRELPLVARRHLGNGQVLSVDCEGIWAWELGREGRAGGESFWLQRVRDLVSVPKSTLEADRQEYLQGEDATLRVPLGHGGPLLVTPPTGALRAVALDGQSATVHLDQLGCWRIQQGMDRVVLVVQKEAREMTEIGRNDSRLKRMADRTSGEMVDIADIASLADHLQARHAFAGENTRSEPLVTSLWWFPLVVLLLGCEWCLRRFRWSLV